MEKFLKILGVCLVILMCVCMVAVGASAESSVDDPARFEGYEFHEDDLTVPKYKVIYPDPENPTEMIEQISYISGNLGRDAAYAPTGAKIVIMCDLYEPLERNVTVEDSDSLSVAVQGKTLSIDFAGHAILSERHTSMFSASENAVFNLYSSKPGAIAIMIEGNSTKGGNFLNASDGAVVTVGKYTEIIDGNEVTYDEKIRTYTASAMICSNSANVKVYNTDMYRAGTDFTSFIRAQGSGVRMELDNVRAIGSHRDLQFAIHNGARDCVITVKNSLMANMSNVGGHFIRYMSDGCAINFENTVFDHISFTCESYYKKSADETDVPDAVVSIGGKCSFSTLPSISSASDIFKFPDLAVKGETDIPKCIYVNKAQEDIKFINVSDFAEGSPDAHYYTFRDYEQTIAGVYCFTTKDYLEYSAEIAWNYNGKSVYQWWIIGETPYPYDIKLPTETSYVEYVVSDPTPVEEYSMYFIIPKVNLNFYYNFTIEKDLKVNIYVPVVEGSGNAGDIVSRVAAGGTVSTKTQLEESEIAKIGGTDYYKVSLALPFNRVTDRFNVVIDVLVPGLSDTKVSISTKIDMVSDINSFLDGDGTDEFKGNIEKFLYAVRNAYTKSDISVPEGIEAIIEKRYS